MIFRILAYLSEHFIMKNLIVTALFAASAIPVFTLAFEQKSVLDNQSAAVSSLMRCAGSYTTGDDSCERKSEAQLRAAETHAKAVVRITGVGVDG